MGRLTALLGALALVVAACGDAADTTTTTIPPPATTAAGATTSTQPPAATSSTSMSVAPAPTTTAAFVPAEPGHGGEVVIGLDLLPASLNPYAPGDGRPTTTLVGQLYLVGIAEVDASLQRVPDVLAELPSVANGGVAVNDDGTMTVRYRIREEARWADGIPISGDDFLFTLEALMAAGGASFTFDEDPYALVAPGSAKAGPKTFEFTMEEPTLLHENMFAAIVPAHDVAGTELLTDWNDRAWVEGGPFRFEEWVPGESVSFVRNDQYWKTDPATGAALPYLDRVVVRLIPDTEELLREFAGRGVDVMEPPPSTYTLGQLEPAESAGATITARDSVIWEHLNFQFGENNPNEGSLNRHLAYRRAVAHALDRQALADLSLWANSGQPLGSYLEVFAPQASGPGWDRYPYDPDRARELLTELCAELGRDCDAEPPTLVFATTSNADERPRIAAEVQRMLGEVGIEVELDLQDSSQYFGPVLDGGAWDVGLWAWVGLPGSASLVTIAEIFDPARPPPDGQNFYRWGTPAVTAAADPVFAQAASPVTDEHTARYAEIVDEMRRTVDVGALHALAGEAEEILADQVVIVPLLARGSLLAWWPDEVGGVEPNPSQSGFTWNVERWYRTDR